MKLDGVIFDLDGTLLDTTEGVLESAIYAAQKMGYKELERSSMLKFVGPPIQNSFIKYYNCDKEEAQRAANIFRTYYKENALLKAKPYDGIFELCDNLKKSGKKMAVATYKREDYARTILKYFGFDKYFESMHGADNENILTKADIVNLCIEDLNLNKRNSVLVGDTIHDATGARAAGVTFIAVTYGFGFKTKQDVDKYNSIGVAEVPLEILKYIP